MIIEFPNKERANEYSALYFSVVNKINKLTQKHGVSNSVDGNGRLVSYENGIYVEDNSKNLTNGKKTEEFYYVVLYSEKGKDKSKTQLTINHESIPLDEMDFDSIRIVEYVSYIFENGSIRKEGYMEQTDAYGRYRKKFTDDEDELSLAQNLYNCDAHLAFPVALEELRVLEQIINKPNDAELLQTLSQPKDWDISYFPHMVAAS